MHRLPALVVLLICLVACSSSERGPTAEAVPPDSDTTTDGVSSDVGAGGVEGTYPRWVLIDGDGEAVEAILPNVFTPGHTDESGHFDPEGYTRKCIAVSALGSQSLPLTPWVHLDTGTMLPCVSAPWSGLVYLEPGCSGVPHIYASQSSSYLDVGGAVHWARGQVVEPGTAYALDDAGECVERTLGAQKIVPIEPTPDRILNLFPNPPYTVRPAY